MLTALILVVCALYLFLIIFCNRPKGLPPGEWGWPIIGYIRTGNEPVSKFLKRLQDKHGDIFTVKIGQRIIVYMTDYATVKEAFSRYEFSSRPDMFTMKVFRHFKSAGIIFANGQVWQTNRRFTMKVLRDFGFGKTSLTSTVNIEVKNIIDELMETEGKSNKIDWFLNVSAVNVILGITAGKRYDANDALATRYVRFINAAFVSSNRNMQMLNFFPWLVWILPRYIKDKYMNLGLVLKYTDEFLNYLRGIVREHEKTLNEDNPRDFIDMYLIEHTKEKGKLGSIYIEDDYFNLVCVLADLFVAGAETVSSTIRWYCYYMAKYPDIQKKIQDEIDSVVPEDRFPEYDDRERLPYFEASIYEVLRIVSQTPTGLSHSATKNTTLNNFKIPKGTLVECAIELCHKSPKYWKHPERFYPEHFLDEEGKFFVPKEGFLSFVVGKRRCLGESVAKMELVMFISAILHTFDICEPNDQPVLLTPDPTTLKYRNMPRSQNLVFKKRIRE